ncbi:MAG: MBL fold metallo-hydrolase [Sphaerochaeta sp.]|nr:MBL fold metallo-hydrolase [Sphaerochaeta sp.]
MKQRLKLAALLLTIMAVLLPSFLFSRDVFLVEQGKLCIYFLDLAVDEEATDKSGDATILIAPQGEVMLIDSGHPQCGEQVIEALNRLGVERIDLYVASHPHIDHIGSFPQIAQAFPISKVYRSSLVYDSSHYHTFIQTIAQKGLDVETLSEGDSFLFGKDIEVKIYNPSEPITYPQNYPANSTQFVNNQSVGMRLSYGDSSAWFGGDLYMVQERALTTKYGDELQSDVAKANHHGGDTSNSLRWIKTLQPKIVVAMHDDLDSMTVYNNYKKYGAEYHLTLLDGAVRVVMDDRKNYLVTDTKDSWMN